MTPAQAAPYIRYAQRQLRTARANARHDRTSGFFGTEGPKRRREVREALYWRAVLRGLRRIH